MDQVFLEISLFVKDPVLRNSAVDKLSKLSDSQFLELSSDIVFELNRRANNLPLSNNPSFSAKRNTARLKLSTLPQLKFLELASDVYNTLKYTKITTNITTTTTNSNNITTNSITTNLSDQKNDKLISSNQFPTQPNTTTAPQNLQQPSIPNLQQHSIPNVQETTISNVTGISTTTAIANVTGYEQKCVELEKFLKASQSDLKDLQIRYEALEISNKELKDLLSNSNISILKLKEEKEELRAIMDHEISLATAKGVLEMEQVKSRLEMENSKLESDLMLCRDELLSKSKFANNLQQVISGLERALEASQKALEDSESQRKFLKSMYDSLQIQIQQQQQNSLINNTANSEGSTEFKFVDASENSNSGMPKSSSFNSKKGASGGIPTSNSFNSKQLGASGGISTSNSFNSKQLGASGGIPTSNSFNSKPQPRSAFGESSNSIQAYPLDNQYLNNNITSFTSQQQHPKIERQNINAPIANKKFDSYCLAILDLTDGAKRSDANNVLLSMKSVVINCRDMVEYSEHLKSQDLLHDGNGSLMIEQLKGTLSNALTKLMNVAKSMTSVVSGNSSLDANPIELDSCVENLNEVVLDIWKILANAESANAPANNNNNNTGSLASLVSSSNTNNGGGMSRNDSTARKAQQKYDDGGSFKGKSKLQQSVSNISLNNQYRESSTGAGTEQVMRISDLRALLENQTDSIVNSIQTLLTTMRKPPPYGPELSKSVQDISEIVQTVLSSSKKTLNEQSTSKSLYDQGSVILGDLGDCQSKMEDLGRLLVETNGSGGMDGSKTTKQKLATCSYEIAKHVKALINLLESSNQ